MESRRVIYLIGKPLTGKTTLSSLCESSEFGSFRVLYFGVIYRFIVSTCSPSWSHYLETPNEPISSMFLSRMSINLAISFSLSSSKDLLLDGFPRSLDQLNSIKFLAGKEVKQLVVMLQPENDDMLLQRLELRRKLDCRNDDRFDIFKSRSNAFEYELSFLTNALLEQKIDVKTLPVKMNDKPSDVYDKFVRLID